MIEAIQNEVNKVRELGWPDEGKGDLIFTVSLLVCPNDTQSKETDKVILTINHHGNVLNRVIFPKSSHYEYLSLEDEMTYLYNATM